MDYIQVPKWEVKSSRKPGEKEPESPFSAMLDREVKLALVDGSIVTGKLTKIWKYEVTVKTGPKEITCMKNGIISAEVMP